MKVYLETLGCRLNYSEIEALGRALRAAGHQVVRTPQEADVCILNTCAVTAEAARKSRQRARKLARANPNLRLAVTGCYATLAPETVSRLPNVKLVVDNRHKERLAELLQPWSAELDGESWRRLAPDAAPHSPTRTRAFVKVQDGCNNRCTFCIVTVARGPERSRPLPEVVEEIQRLVAAGYQEAVLTGVHLGGYGRDQGSSLHELVAAILEQTSLPRLRLSSLEPWDIEPSFFDLWPASQGRLCPHLHLPLQAGCDRTLKRMARRNRTADFRQLVTEARHRIPGLVITTDIIVGFPGESEADFAESLAFVEAMNFAHVHVFPYSPRQGTPAATFTAQVPVAERRRRVAAMQEVARKTGLAVRRSFLGQVRPVLWEQFFMPERTLLSTKNDSSRAVMPRFSEQMERPANGRGAVWCGLTDNYLRVQAIAEPALDLSNRITAARLTRVSGSVMEAEIVVHQPFERVIRPSSEE